MNLLNKILIEMAEILTLIAEASMKTDFDYRIVEEDGCYSIREVSYDENGDIESYGKDESYPIGVTPDDLAEDLNEMMEAMKKPVLRIRDDELIED